MLGERVGATRGTISREEQRKFNAIPASSEY